MTAHRSDDAVRNENDGPRCDERGDQRPGVLPEIEPPREDVDRSVAVVGAGAVGATVSYDLARQGADVTLYDRVDVAGGSSGRAAGICYGAYAEDLDAEIAGESIERFRTLSGNETFPFTECPYVWLARDGDTERTELIRAQIDRMQANGVVALEMGPEELDERFPRLRTDDVAVAGVVGAAGYTDPATYTAALAAGASGHGARIETGREVAIDPDGPGVESDGDATEYDAVVVTAGAHTKSLFESCGISIAMKPYRVQALTAAADGADGPTATEGANRAYAEPMCYDATAGVYVRPHPEGVLAGDGTERREANPETYDRDGDEWFVEETRAVVDHRLPGTIDRLERAWAGLCTATPDRNPLVGGVQDGLYVATGFQGHGFMRAPAIGRRLADQVLGGPGIDAFDPRRFEGDEAFEIVEGMSVKNRS